MDKKDEALKLALEAAYLAGFNASGEGYNGEYPFGTLEYHNAEEDETWKKDRDNYIKEALAQQEQEPVAWQAQVLIQGVWTPMGNPQRDKDRAEKLAANPSIPKECRRIIELYTALPKRKPLTDGQKQQIHNEAALEQALICLVEAELKEKNT